MFIKTMIRNKALKGLAAGMVGGLAASLVMNLFQLGVQKLGEQLDPMSGDGQSDSPEPKGDDATMKMANRVSENLFDHPLDRDQRARLGPVVHYAFGTMVGGVYGLVAEFSSDARAGFGSAFGSVLFVAADEIAVPLMGLSGPPSKMPAKAHAMALASHIVYGVTTEGIRKAARSAM